MTSYSQAGEDIAIVKAFTRRPCDERPDASNFHVGRLLDIGAWHPKQLSNSRALIERGWSAVLVEPSPGPLRDLIREYADADCVQVIGAAVGVERDWITMHVTDDAVSSSVSGVHDLWREQGGYFGTMKLMTISIAELLNHFGGNFDFVNIDAEGATVDICLSLLAAGPRPKVICCEHDGRMVELGKRVTDMGYRIDLLNDTNVVMVHG